MFFLHSSFSPLLWVWAQPLHVHKRHSRHVKISDSKFNLWRQFSEIFSSSPSSIHGEGEAEMWRGFCFSVADTHTRRIDNLLYCILAAQKNTFFSSSNCHPNRRRSSREISPPKLKMKNCNQRGRMRGGEAKFESERSPGITQASMHVLEMRENEAISKCICPRLPRWSNNIAVNCFGERYASSDPTSHYSSTHFYIPLRFSARCLVAGGPKKNRKAPFFYQTSRKSLARGAENNFAGKSNNWVLGRFFFLHLSSNRCSMGLEKKSPGPYLAPSVCFKYVARF